MCLLIRLLRAPSSSSSSSWGLAGRFWEVDDFWDVDSLSSEDGLPSPIPVAGAISKVLLGAPEAAFEVAAVFALKKPGSLPAEECLSTLSACFRANGNVAHRLPNPVISCE